MRHNPLLAPTSAPRWLLDGRAVCVVPLAAGEAVYSVMRGTSSGYRSRGAAAHAESAVLYRTRERAFRGALTGSAEEDTPCSR